MEGGGGAGEMGENACPYTSFFYVTSTNVGISQKLSDF